MKRKIREARTAEGQTAVAFVRSSVKVASVA